MKVARTIFSLVTIFNLFPECTKNLFKVGISGFWWLERLSILLMMSFHSFLIEMNGKYIRLRIVGNFPLLFTLAGIQVQIFFFLLLLVFVFLLVLIDLIIAVLILSFLHIFKLFVVLLTEIYCTLFIIIVVIVQEMMMIGR